jgi:putative membrane protein
MSGSDSSTTIKMMLAGAAAGFAATVPMTGEMILAHRLLPRVQRHALPPRKITMNLADALGVKHGLSRPQRTGATLAAHFSYGSAMGAVFGLLGPRVPGFQEHAGARVASGIGWGLVVWALSYLGVLPALDLHRSATREPAERNLLMVLAHVVWGATLGLLWAAETRSPGE